MASKNMTNCIQYVTLTGMKLLCLDQPVSKRFYPLFEADEIIGTQFLPEEPADDGSESSADRGPESESLGLTLPNFRTKDFQFRTELASAGYK